MGFINSGCQKKTDTAKDDQVKSQIDLPDYCNTPDAMALLTDGTIILSVPNFTDPTSPGILMNISNDNEVSLYSKLPAHPVTGRVYPMGIRQAPSGDLYVADCQVTENPKGHSRLLRVHVKDGKPTEVSVVAEGLDVANGVAIRDGFVYLTDSVIDKLDDGAVLSAVYRFKLDEQNVKVQPGGKDPHIIATMKTYDKDIQIGADGIDFDAKGNLLVANCGDATIEKIVFDDNGKEIERTVFGDADLMKSSDGIFYDTKTDLLYVADILNNSIVTVTPDGKIAVVAKNGDSTGANGLLDGPSEAVVRGNEIIVANFDRVFPGSVNTNPDKPYTLSVIKTEPNYQAIAGQEPNTLLSIDNNNLLDTLKDYPYKIVHESYRNNNWELIIRNADGSEPVNLTNTPGIDELYPKASPKGDKIAFVADEGSGDKRTRNVYLMDVDGTNRIKIGNNGRQPFWKPDGKTLCFLRGERLVYGEGGSANKEMYYYNIETNAIEPHPKKDLAGLLNPCWSAGKEWFVSSVMGGMEIGHSICAIDSAGKRVVELRRSLSESEDIYQCRPDISPDGKWIAWCKEDCYDCMWLEIGQLDFSNDTPKVTNLRYAVKVDYPMQIYHADWSPENRFVSYAMGGRGTKMEPAGYVVGTKAKGWNIYIADPSKHNVVVQITNDGLSNKEPDWIRISSTDSKKD